MPARRGPTRLCAPADRIIRIKSTTCSAFPFIFRGALDVQARAINEEMKAAAAKALAALAHEDVPDAVLNAYNLHALKFGPDYIIPKPLDPRVMLWVSPAVAEAAHALGRGAQADQHRRIPRAVGANGSAPACACGATSSTKRKPRPSASSSRKAKNRPFCAPPPSLPTKRIGQPILLGRPEIIQKKVQELGLHFTPQIVDPATDYRAAKYAQAFLRTAPAARPHAEPGAAAHCTSRTSSAC